MTSKGVWRARGGERKRRVCRGGGGCGRGGEARTERTASMYQTPFLVNSSFVQLLQASRYARLHLRASQAVRSARDAETEHRKRGEQAIETERQRQQTRSMTSQRRLADIAMLILDVLQHLCKPLLQLARIRSRESAAPHMEMLNRTQTATQGEADSLHLCLLGVYGLPAPGVT